LPRKKSHGEVVEEKYPVSPKIGQKKEQHMKNTSNLKNTGQIGSSPQGEANTKKNKPATSMYILYI